MVELPPVVEVGIDPDQAYIVADLPYVDIFATALMELGIKAEEFTVDRMLTIDDMAEHARENGGLYAFSGNKYYRFHGVEPVTFKLLAEIYSAIADWAMTRKPELFEEEHEDVLLELVKGVFSMVLYNLDRNVFKVL